MWFESKQQLVALHNKSKLGSVCLQVNSMANNKSPKPVASNTKPTTNQVPTEVQPAVTTNAPSSPAAKEPDHAVYTPISTQNGLKHEEPEDIFSPLREGM